MEEKKRTNLNLKSKILREYLYIILPILYYIAFYFMMKFLNSKIDGWTIVLIALPLFVIFCAIILITYIINPIRILIVHKLELKSICSKKKRILCYITVIFPIIFALVIALLGPITNYLRNQYYYGSKSAYSVNYNDYKSAKQFEKELYKRGLLYNEESEKLLLELNKKYDIKNNNKEYYYEEASLMTLFDNTFYDSKDGNEVIEFNSSKKAPAYIYNCILTLPDKNENLRYAPISRYHRYTHISGTNYPFFEDFYIECKILYVDGDIYAIIGVSQSYSLSSCFSNFEDKQHNIEKFYDYPYYMILSEKDTITTFVDNKYHSDGAIENHGNRFNMRCNTNQPRMVHNYPIQKVERLDVDTINNFAKQLQLGILKESIDYHYKQK